MLNTYLSLFSGIGGFECAIQKVFPDARCIGYSEIDKNAIKIYQKNFPNHKNLGNIEDLDIKSLPQNISLLVAGFPCQDLSIGNKTRGGLDGKRSGLFWVTLDILKHVKPEYFIIENVNSMSKENEEIITQELGVDPIMLNSATFTGQTRKRLFWTNIRVQVLPTKADKQYFKHHLLPINKVTDLALSEKGLAYMSRKVRGGRTHWDFGHHSDTCDEYCHCITANIHKGVPYNVLIDRRGKSNTFRKFHPIELERLQGFPDNWTAMVANTHRYKTIGNAVNVQVIKYILGYIKGRVAI